MSNPLPPDARPTRTARSSTSPLELVELERWLLIETSAPAESDLAADLRRLAAAPDRHGFPFAN